MSFSWAVTDNTKRPSPKPEPFLGYFTDIQRAARRSLPKRPDKDLCRLLGLALVPAGDETERARRINEQVQRGEPGKGPDVEGVEKDGEKVIGKDLEQSGSGVKSNKRTFAETILSKLPCVNQEKECSDREKMISSFAVYLAIVIFVLLIILVVLAATISALGKDSDDSPGVLSEGHSSPLTPSTRSLTLFTTSPSSSTLTKSYSKSSSASTLTSVLTSIVASKATALSVSSSVQTKVTTSSSVTFLTSDTSTRLSSSTGAKSSTSLTESITPTISSSTTRSAISSARSTTLTIFMTSSAKASRSSTNLATSPAESVKTSLSSKASSSASSFSTTMSSPLTHISSSTVKPVTSSRTSFTRSTTSTNIYSSTALHSSPERSVTSSSASSSTPTSRGSTFTTKSSSSSISSSSSPTTLLASSTTSSSTSSAPLPLFEAPRITCTSPTCLAAGKTLGRVDFGTSPCSDFYEFACGGWINATINQLADANQRNVPVTLRDEMRLELLKQMQVLLQAVYYDTDSLKVRISRRLYQACRESNYNGDTDLGEDQLRESLEELRDVVRGFGLAAGGVMHSTLHKSLYVALNTFQITPFFKMATIIMDDGNNGKVYGIQLSPPTMYLDSKSYRGPIENNNAAQTYITRVSEVLFIFLSSYNNDGYIPGIPNNGRRKRQDGGLSYEEIYFKVLDSFSIDVNISKIIERTSSANSDREIHHSIVQFSDLKDLYPNINWDAALGAIPDNAIIRLENPDYFEALNADLPSLNEENVKLFVFLSVLIQRVWPYMPYPLRNMIRDIRKDNSPIYSTLDCVEKTIELAPEETHALYVAQYTQQVLEKRLKIADLENTVSQVFKTLLAQTTWVANDLELVVSVFLANVKLVFSPVRSYIRETEGIVSARKSLLSLAVELHQQKQGYEEFLVTKWVDENNYIRDWTSTYLSYEASLNIIAVPTGIVTFLTNDQQPRFDLHGNVGAMLAEQIIKVLTGEMKDGAEPTWWGDENRKRFSPVQECYTTQFTEAQQADAGNVIIANAAFQLIDEVFRTNSPFRQTPIDNTAFTEEMLFFINAVQLECSADTEENKLRKIRFTSTGLGLYTNVLPKDTPMNPAAVVGLEHGTARHKSAISTNALQC